MGSELQWHADREQLRAALDADHGDDLAQLAAELQRRCRVLETENAHLRALVGTGRYLSSHPVDGTLAADEASDTLANQPPEPLPLGVRAFADLLACPRCREHLGSDLLVVDACASVALETSRSVGDVLVEYLTLQHERQHREAPRR